MIWFGAIRMLGAIGSLLLIEVIRRWRTESLASHTVVSRTLFWINTFQMLAVLVLATTGNFAIEDVDQRGTAARSDSGAASFCEAAPGLFSLIGKPMAKPCPRSCDAFLLIDRFRHLTQPLPCPS